MATTTYKATKDGPICKRSDEHYQAIVIGHIWQPGCGVCSYVYDFWAFEKPEATNIDTQAGDFQKVIDYQLSQSQRCKTCGHYHWVIIKDWESEENELAYLDTVTEPEEL